jgi:hypothetical protein
MAIIKEPKNIDLSTKSEPWNENELADFRKLMEEIRSKNKSKKLSNIVTKQKVRKT